MQNRLSRTQSFKIPSGVSIMQCNDKSETLASCDMMLVIAMRCHIVA